MEVVAVLDVMLFCVQTKNTSHLQDWLLLYLSELNPARSHNSAACWISTSHRAAILFNFIARNRGWFAEVYGESIRTQVSGIWAKQKANN